MTISSELDELKQQTEAAVAIHWTKGRLKWEVADWPRFVTRIMSDAPFSLSGSRDASGAWRYIARFRGGKQVTAPDAGVAIYVAALSAAGADVSKLLSACHSLVHPRRNSKLSLTDRRAILDRATKGEASVSIHKDYPAVTYQALTHFLRAHGFGRPKKPDLPRKGVRTLSKRRPSA